MYWTALGAHACLTYVTTVPLACLVARRNLYPGKPGRNVTIGNRVCDYVNTFRKCEYRFPFVIADMMTDGYYDNSAAHFRLPDSARYLQAGVARIPRWQWRGARAVWFGEFTRRALETCI